MLCEGMWVATLIGVVFGFGLCLFSGVLEWLLDAR